MNDTHSPTNGQPPRDPRGAAGYYLRRGWRVIPVPHKSKNPNFAGWPSLEASEADLDNLFPEDAPSNIGILTGAPSGGLIDIDLDAAQAIAAAPHLLPTTGVVSGRASKRRSHWWYIVADPPAKKSEEFHNLDEKMLVELRSSGGQTIAPWSVHETGEIVGWEQFEEPALIEIEELRKAVARVAAAALLARHWPEKGARHAAAKNLAGGLLAGGWSTDETEAFFRAICAAAEDPELTDRLNTIQSTAEKIEEGEAVTGWPSLGKCLTGNGAGAVKRVRKWLGLQPKKEGKGGGDKTSAATELVKLAVALVKDGFFHTAEQVAYARVPFKTHVEVWPLRSTSFRRLLARVYFELTEKSANGQAILDALGILEGMALFTAPELPVYVRTAEHKGKLYLDLADKEWRVVEIDTAGWRIVAPSPINFRRSKGTLTLPVPEMGGKIDDLRPFVNVRNDGDWLLLLGWIFAAMRPRGPYPCLALSGEQGTAKSTLGRNLQKLIDPSVADLRSEPKEPRDLMIAASASWLVAYDNLSHLPQWLSDCLCRLATGGGFATRQLYTDDEEMLFNAMRPALLTSISDVVTAGDLLDRTVCLQLETIQEDKRKTDEALALAFDKARPRILGALLDGLAAGLRLLPTVQLDRLPRMADFALWAEACLRGVGYKPGSFLEAYSGNRAEVNALVLEASPLVPFLLRREGFKFKGEASELLNELNQLADEKTQKQKGWPTKPHVLSGMLRRMAPNLRRVGMTVQFEREGKSRKRTITLEREAEKEAEAESNRDGASAASAASAIPDGPDVSPFCGTGYDDSCATTLESEQASAERPPDASERPPSSKADAREDWRTLGGRSEENQASALNSNQDKELTSMADAADAPSRSFSASLSDGTAYRLVRDPSELSMLAQAVQDSSRVALDIETTGLDPRRDRVRLLQLGTERGLYIVDCFAVDPRPVFDSLADAVLIGHNLSFDLSFLAAVGFQPGDVRCTMLLSQLLYGTRRAKGFHTLQQTAQREIGAALDKEQQRSDWTAPQLSREQIEYAAADVAVLMPLYDALAAKIDAAGMSRVADIENRCLPALVWLEQAGVPFDREAWQALAEQAKHEAEELGRQLDELAPDRDGYLSKTGAWNWDSPPQVQEVMQLLGFNLAATDDDALAAVPHPIADLIRRRRSAKKRTTTYGAKWLKHVAEDGRVYAGFHQIGTGTGRMSCSAPNVQQIPNDPAYRRCFRAAEGRVLVKADYSQIELRIACRIAGERNMGKAYNTGADLHRITAQKMTGREEVTKQERALAKPVNFGMIYGLSPDGLRRKAKSEYGIDLSEQDAVRFRDAFFAAWPDIKRWHNGIRAADQSEVPTLAGRLLRLPEKRHFGMTANYSVQGTGGDGMKAALGLLWERRGECPGARPVLVIHDEIVLECPQDQAEQAAEWLKRAMIDGMAPLIEPVPVEVEVKIATTWGGD